MPDVYEHHLSVADEDLDRHGHVNNIAFLRWMQDAATRHSDAQGWSYQDYQRLGATWFVRSHHIDYLHQAFPGDDVIVKTWVTNMRKIRSLRKYKIVRLADGKLLAKAETDWVFVNIKTGRPIPVPPEVVECFDLLEPCQEP
jgi:acyl-CoA thioester hydrolase